MHFWALPVCVQSVTYFDRIKGKSGVEIDARTLSSAVAAAVRQRRAALGNIDVHVT